MSWILFDKVTASLDTVHGNLNPLPKGDAMQSKKRTVEKIVEEQVRQWQLLQREFDVPQTPPPVVTLSREPGSGGQLVAKKIAETLDMTLFEQEVLHQMAQNAEMSSRLVESLDEKGLNVMEEYIAALVHQRHLWPDQYLRHLLKVIGTIGKHGHAVVIGRGANFVLPPERALRVRVVAPFSTRAANVAQQFGVSRHDAERRITHTDSNRKSFVRKYFNADIAAPLNYDVIINTAVVSLDEAAAMVCAGIRQRWEISGISPGSTPRANLKAS
jgi:cytidylate kinase